MPDIREEFEAWHHAEFGYVVKAEDDPNHDGQCAKRWKTWQASRAALKVELPEPVDISKITYSRYVLGIKEVKEALQQAGIEVK
ncbi:hypothetical protein [Pseudomonas nitroreducens]|uniref:hypothetical protein n=1 Tax=Pseudomonas nitroreducens TaxID=46680 RepID=UPI003D2900F4